MHPARDPRAVRCEGMTEAFERLVAPIATAGVEIGVIVYIGGDGQLVGVRHVRGHRDGVEFPLRSIVADALASGSHSIAIAHNHPSGCATMSDVDVSVTRRLSRTLAAVEIRLLDHFILTPGAWTSMRRAGASF